MNRTILYLLLISLLVVSGCDSQRSNPVDPAAVDKTVDKTVDKETKQKQVADAETAAVIDSKELLPTIDWEDAPHHIGEEVFLVGQVANTGKSSGGHRARLP